jgi:plasmid stabilization system protein ParE
LKQALFTSAAEADVEEAFAWYESQRPGLGAVFRHALDIMVAAVVSNPVAYAVVYRQTRRALLPKFPYGLFYRVQDDAVVVIACIHAKRNPRIWRSR